MLLLELVKTASMRVDLWRAQRELRRLQSEFPPRRGASPFWPALLLVAAGAAVFLHSRRTPRPAPAAVEAHGPAQPALPREPAARRAADGTIE